MKISLNWLKQFIEINESTQELDNLLTGTGLEVEGIEEHDAVPGGLRGFVIAEVLTCERFLVKEKQLSLTTVNIGTDTPAQIVCGAANVEAGQKVVVATVGTTLYGKDGQAIFTIDRKKTYGHFSEGMICAEDELGLGNSHDGIMVLDTDLPNGTPAAEYFKLESDKVIEIGLTPNRADAASHLGVARDIKAVTGREIIIPSVESFKVDNQNFPIELIVEDAEACPRFCGLTIDGVTVKDSPEWLQKYLKTIGLRPINNIVDITNFICHGLGQPMHAYDWHAIKGQKVIVKTLEAGTKFKTLDEVERTLSATDLMICNADEPMGIAGIFGGTKSGIKDETTRVYLEVAYFDPSSVRKTAMFHSLKTDASFRFERGTDPNLKLYTLKYAALLIQELAGGVVASEVSDFYPVPVEDFKIEVLYKNIDRLIGKKLEKSLIKSILQSLEIEITGETEDGFLAIVPPFRVDVTREADVIEEILRIYGFDNVELSENLGTDFLSAFPAKDRDKLQLKLTQILAANGFNEIITNSLTKPSYSELIKGELAGENVEILNKLSEDLGVMRQTMLFSGLEVLAYNINRRQKDLKMFDFGKTYHKINDKYVEKRHLALFVTGNTDAETWQVKSEKVAFHTLAGAVAKVLYSLGLRNFESKPLEDSVTFEYGLSYTLNKKEVVRLGLVKANLAKKAEVKQAVFFADFDWDYLFKQHSDKAVFSELPKFPEVRRDLSLVLDKAVTFDQIQKLARQYEKNLLSAINVFDVYQGDNLGEGKKSYSVSFILQDFEQTLTDKVIDKTMERLMGAFEKELGAVIRK
ncbi:phenylalanyl-tRNA synthetase beta subunit [Pseudarcicella hirudinis]|uniref:Phenylalanine--tRNA ligase beta subunit n=1 Tax=Pseudarcicella hirudinis TaxID=1079859 RepID=A0A1I5VY98_9BACT|nr:phenylalanine--tRNA ligase subunit beta [Pseudarcicella hirudinis]SFQ12508.1 phenylalanyl-tRNA synthetase beta subunit [Pseudarcicella hirudinis]